MFTELASRSSAAALSDFSTRLSMLVQCCATAFWTDRKAELTPDALWSSHLLVCAASTSCVFDPATHPKASTRSPPAALPSHRRRPNPALDAGLLPQRRAV